MFKHVTITKRSLKSQGITEEGLRNCGSRAARLVHVPLRKDRLRGDPKRLPPFFTFLAGGDSVVTYKTPKCNKQGFRFSSRFYFVFLDLSSSSGFSLFCRCFYCRWPIWWLGGLLLLLLHFSGWRSL